MKRTIMGGAVLVTARDLGRQLQETEEDMDDSEVLRLMNFMMSFLR